jgi:hypothetical protein
MMASVFFLAQSIQAQMYVRVKFDPCPDECTTQEDCVYRAYYAIDDTCGGITHWCDGNEDMTCDQYSPNGILIICPDCSDVTHNPCYRVAIRLEKICIGSGGSHVVCKGSALEYHACYEFDYPGVLIEIEWD